MAMRKTGVYLLVSLSFISSGLLFFLISFATANWLVQDGPGVSKFRRVDNLGLWEVCFTGWSHYKDFSQKKYDGCWWIISNDFDNIREYINPSWFVGIKAILCINLVVEIVMCIILAITMLGVLREKFQFPFLLSTGIAGFVTLIQTMACMITFKLNSMDDKEWLGFNTLDNSVSWSFYLMIPSLLCILTGSLFSVLCAIRVRRELRDAYPQATPYRGSEMHSRTSY